MTFVWDRWKNRGNQRKHGVSFEDAAYVFADETAVSYLERVAGGEERWHTIGIAGAIVLLVAHTWEVHDDEEEIRIISARKAGKREKSLYVSSK